MKIRQAKRRAQEMHGHYQIHSYRQTGNDVIKYVDLTEREWRQSTRVRVGISHAKPWRTHV